ncbi:MAG: hypothetical protein OMM_14939, partial [Candidatus Magnetoglobus multicellularis str. Araruama]
ATFYSNVNLAFPSFSISHTTLTSVATESHLITIPNRSGIIVLTGDGNINLTSTEIQDNAVTQNKLKSDSVDSSKIIDNSITGTDILDSSIETTDIANFAITYTKIANAAITYTKIADGTILATKLASENQALTNGEDGQSLLSNGDGTFQWGTGGTDFTQDTVSVGSDTSAFTLTRLQHTSGAGTTFVIKGQDASGANQDGGDIEFIPGSPTGTGDEGSVIIHRSSAENIFQASNIEND